MEKEIIKVNTKIKLLQSNDLVMLEKKANNAIETMLENNYILETSNLITSSNDFIEILVFKIAHSKAKFSAKSKIEIKLVKEKYCNQLEKNINNVIVEMQKSSMNLIDSTIFATQDGFVANLTFKFCNLFWH